MKNILAAIGVIAVVVFIANSFKSNNTQSGTAQEQRRSSQQIVFCANQYRVLSEATMDMDCRSACSKYAVDINDYMGRGWRVESSTPKQVLVRAADSRYEWQKCACVGTEYVISR